MNTSEEILPEFYYKYMDKEGVMDKWIMVNTPFPTLAILTAYISFVLYLGPKMMKGRPPLQLQSYMIVYNLFQVTYNIWLLHMVFSSNGAITYLYEHSCQPGDPNKTYQLRYLFHVSTWYYLTSKIIDLLDTCFLILRKKQSHITYLHLYHHFAMVFFTWVSLKYVKAQQATPIMLLNTFVHVVMYAYYFLASFGPQVQKYLWWKRYLTLLQLAQFAAVILYLAIQYLKHCHVDHAFNAIWIVNVSVIAGFFINFYVQTYVVKSIKTVKEQN